MMRTLVFRVWVIFSTFSNGGRKRVMQVRPEEQGRRRGGRHRLPPTVPNVTSLQENQYDQHRRRRPLHETTRDRDNHRYTKCWIVVWAGLLRALARWFQKYSEHHRSLLEPFPRPAPKRCCPLHSKTPPEPRALREARPAQSFRRAVAGSSSTCRPCSTMRAPILRRRYRPSGL